MGISDTLRGVTSRARAAALALAASLAVAALAGCSSAADPARPSDAAVAGASASDVSVSAAADVIAQRDVVVLDVRTPAAFASGHLADAINIDVSGSTFDDEVAALSPDATYVVYCRSGNRSAAAVDRMLDLGFTDLYNMTGGVLDWEAAGGELVTS